MIPIFEQAQRFTQLWADLAQQMASVALPGNSSPTPPEAAQQIRSRVFQSMSETTEQFLRSPTFLESVKQTVDASLAFQKRINDMLTAMHHSTQGIARQDIDSLMLLIRHLETRLLDRIEDLDTRMDDLADKVAALQTRHPKPAKTQE